MSSPRRRKIRLFSLETLGTVHAVDDFHEPLHTFRGVSLGVGEVIVDAGADVQIELIQNLGLFGVAQHQELIGTGGGSQLDALGSQAERDEQLGSIGMLRSLEDGDGADLGSGA